ncbi:hypothetical protein [Mycobacteroides abscessus]|uniref:hypothetical protein n=1 Tax=Mycobacteroides abscessus TaxID=36809 RepID=UPI0005E9C744|nr:hypothetical protein [Mycobacteroides abscessus]MBN7300648.1 hypothetical protein [Mycobacteroides abscessus subsp. bolletii]MBN7455500.1 hypothetical protein [Mycobacteroides abscessus subsp. abscessus]MBN7545569.1 hypothetical protein [Mycobacteroides abscessus subsp. abscessus]MBN7569443.1 hypothetical protein [Mycobacteroides abscessus subsp. abscessus]MDO3127053.1 hypothetical protein [Mycobacteroides abscessus subsp. bolletii]
MSYSERYRNGETVEVWRDLWQLGSRVREPRYLEDATEVAYTMAIRARRNIELIADRLVDSGFVAHTNDSERKSRVPFIPAGEDSRVFVAQLTEKLGPIPLTVASWIEFVGDVWLVGSHPRWPGIHQSDPLVVEFECAYSGGHSVAYSYYEGEYEEWLKSGIGSFQMDFAPDRLHKANISGDEPYGIFVPDACVDGTVNMGGRRMSFVSYLNWVFKAGGFPLGDGADARALREGLGTGIREL